MRRFHSYGPVDCRYHFCVERRNLVEQCFNQLMGIPEEGGHYFTIWSPRQNGKTWLIQQASKKITETYGDRFTIFSMSFGVFRGIEFEDTRKTRMLPETFTDHLKTELPGKPEVKTLDDFRNLFSKTSGCWDRPLILYIDEVDTVSPQFLDIVVGQFRELYLNRSNNRLHGLALIGVRAVLGIESKRGSPFNIQRSLHVPNFTPQEVEDLYRQYQDESGQTIDPEVVQRVYDETSGHPGLTCWFGELLTETYNTDKPSPITSKHFDYMYMMATQALPNNTVLNLISKANEEPYKQTVLELFKTERKIEFAFDNLRLNYLYMNGVIDMAPGEDKIYVRFSSPFVQKRLFSNFSRELFDYMGKLYEPFEDLSDTITEDSLNIRNLMKRLEAHLEKNRDWLLKDAPRRKDLRIYEAVFHFNLYRFVYDFLGTRLARVFPEFPTGNGKVDIIIEFKENTYALEVKSYTNEFDYREAILQAAEYGRKLKLSEIWLVFFVETIDDANRKKYEKDCTDSKTDVTVKTVFVGTGC